MTRYLRTGAIAGIVAGVALALFLVTVGERSLGQAVQLQTIRAIADTGSAPDQMFTRGGQLLGGILGSVVFGLGLGAVFGAVFAATRHRLPGRDDLQRALWLAVGALVILWVVPAIKYPPNPPGVGDPATITRRTMLWLTLVGWSLLCAWATTRLGKWLSARGMTTPACLSAQIVTYVGLIVIASSALPPTGDPVTVPANLIWHFRLSSIAGQVIMWVVLGMTFGWLEWRRESQSHPLSTAATAAL